MGLTETNHEECQKEVAVLKESIIKKDEYIVLLQKYEAEVDHLRTEIKLRDEVTISLSAKYQENVEHLEKAEEYILQMQGQETGNEADRIIRLEQALEQEYQNQQQIREHYEIQITNINNINIEYEQRIKVFQAEFKVFQTQITELTTTIHQAEHHHHPAAIETKTTDVTQKQEEAGTTGVDLAVYEALVVDNSKRTLRIMILLQEIERLDHLSADVRVHLGNAENYIS